MGEDTKATTSTASAGVGSGGDDEVVATPCPDLALSQLCFLLTTSDDVTPADEKTRARTTLLAAVREKHMAPFYRAMCAADTATPLDAALLAECEAANAAALAEFDAKEADARENAGESEVRQAAHERADYLTRIGDRDAAVEAYSRAWAKSSTGQKLDIVFAQIRLGFFVHDNELAARNIAEAKQLVELGGDWDRRNRLKVYEAVHCMLVRNFTKAAELLLATLSTFSAVELMSFNQYIYYTVLMSLVSLERTTLKKRVVNAPEVLTVVHELPHLQPLLDALYGCDYQAFFTSLADIMDTIKRDTYLAEHARFFCREMRVKAYQQQLASYSSVNMASMAADFGVSVDFLDRELSRFISVGRLHCKIDRVAGVIETNHPDAKNAQYQTTIKQGDLLLNRVQKLSRVLV